ncbi:uncharacterized protein LOC109793484 [Cajanus cajan]|uniref:uncharacterized protein LOC109793484 n=1 Tax=Cajanus cajan TaxID=3821 RepID=UPI0010FB1F5A|nr:uncharacterized protein LOC109793484 [Cajanus cajan]
MSKTSFKLTFLFVILAIEACHGVSPSRKPITEAGDQCFFDEDCIKYLPSLNCEGASAKCGIDYNGKRKCFCYYGMKEPGISPSRIPITEAGDQCFTDNDCIKYLPSLHCEGGASAKCGIDYSGKRKCFCYYGMKEPGLSSSRLTTIRCVTNNDCLFHLPNINCHRASLPICQQGACYCKL